MFEVVPAVPLQTREDPVWPQVIKNATRDTRAKVHHLHGHVSIHESHSDDANQSPQVFRDQANCMWQPQLEKKESRLYQATVVMY